MSHHRRYYGNLLSRIDNEEVAQMLPCNVRITNNSPESLSDIERHSNIDLRNYYKPMNLPDYFGYDEENTENEKCHDRLNTHCSDYNTTQISVHPVLTNYKKEYVIPKGSIELAGKTYKIYGTNTHINETKYEPVVKNSSLTQKNSNTPDSGPLISKTAYLDRHLDESYPNLSISGIKCDIDLLKR
uniref:Uncharacterized protein n=1 Tax=Octopus bimaculoides TaxID=37653 RepID=A0A0L8G3D0_OCTBM